MESGCESADAPHGSEVSSSMPKTCEGMVNYVSANDVMGPSLNSTEIGVASSSGCGPSASNGVSERIERMMQTRSEYGSALEFEVDASKVHWSQLENLTSDDEEGNSETDLEAFQRLQEKWGEFFLDFGDALEVGEKIAEGGQAEIFNAVWTDPKYMGEYVLKVFKEGFALRDLEKQWPLGMLQQTKLDDSNGYFHVDCCSIGSGTLVKNGRFAFHMVKYWGDLRKLIDLRMQQNHNELPPFTNLEVGYVLVDIARGMLQLHEHNIVHRDLKASNVLIDDSYDEILKGEIYCAVADFECSVGVVGTGFWRAPEILQGLQNSDIKPDLFTEKSDVYSFAMTCYEVITGCIPFEGVAASCYSIILEGQRPELPKDTDPLLKALLSRCWHANPLERPSFEGILECMMQINPIVIGFGV